MRYMDDKPICVTMFWMWSLEERRREYVGQSVVEGMASEWERFARFKLSYSIVIFMLVHFGLGTNEPEPFPRVIHTRAHFWA